MGRRQEAIRINQQQQPSNAPSYSDANHCSSAAKRVNEWCTHSVYRLPWSRPKSGNCRYGVRNSKKSSSKSQIIFLVLLDALRSNFFLSGPSSSKWETRSCMPSSLCVYSFSKSRPAVTSILVATMIQTCQTLLVLLQMVLRLLNGHSIVGCCCCCCWTCTILRLLLQQFPKRGDGDGISTCPTPPISPMVHQLGVCNFGCLAAVAAVFLNILVQPNLKTYM